ncbi:MAG: FxLYD domain-containing protein, partial [Nitrososphaeraceae archaeon]
FLISLVCFGVIAFNTDLYMFSGITYAIENGSDIVIKDPGSFLDNTGRLNIIGVVDNNGEYPIGGVVVGLNLTDKSVTLFPDNSSASDSVDAAASSTTNATTTTVTGPTFARIIYPGTGAPFKIILERSGVSMASVGQPFISAFNQLDTTHYDILKLNYTNLAVGSEKALVGTVENTSPFSVHNVRVYASAHDNTQTQIDSAISKNIPTIEPGQEIQFELTPNPSIKSDVIYFSCAGVELDAPITTLKTPDGGFVAYDLQALAKIIDLKYNGSSNSIVFGADHYNPDGGSITMKVPQMYDDQKIGVLMDGKPDDNAEITADGKTIKISIFIPPEEHKLQILGVAPMTT